MNGNQDSARPTTLGRTARLLALGLAGYGVFAAGAVLYLAISHYRDEFAIVHWSTGVLVAAPFASAEFLNSGRGRNAGFTRRLRIASLVMVVSLLIMMVPRDAWWRPTKQAPGSWRLLELGGVLGLYGIGLLAAGLAVPFFSLAGVSETEREDPIEK